VSNLGSYPSQKDLGLALQELRVITVVISIGHSSLVSHERTNGIVVKMDKSDRRVVIRIMEVELT
jgi:hypothetical protein